MMYELSGRYCYFMVCESVCARRFESMPCIGPIRRREFLILLIVFVRNLSAEKRKRDSIDLIWKRHAFTQCMGNSIEIQINEHKKGSRPNSRTQIARVAFNLRATKNGTERSRMLCSGHSPHQCLFSRSNIFNGFNLGLCATNQPST